MGIESAQATYHKLKDIDTIALTRELQSHGIRVQASTIVGMEHHTQVNMRGEIEHAVAHGADCHQFMLYTPVPGTPLHAQMAAEGRILGNVDLADIHGQYKFNFVHEHIARDDSKSWLDWAFRRDYEINGPSLFRMMRTMFEGWKRYRDDGDERVRSRFTLEAEKTAAGIRCGVMGDGALSRAIESRGERSYRGAPTGYGARVRPVVGRRQSPCGSRAAVGGAPRSRPVSCRPAPRAADVRRSQKLVAAGPPG
jgi:hypothetical protein